MIRTSIPKFVDTFVAFLKSDLCPKTMIPIVVGGQDFFGLNEFIYYNVEQLSRKNNISVVDSISKNPNCKEIWDYSKSNVEIFNSLNLSMKSVHVPPKLPDSYLNTFREYRVDNQIYDIGFCGSESIRRTLILDSLTNFGYKVLRLTNIYGVERDKELAKCKILINIHCYDDYNIFEIERCEPYLIIGVPVISERSLDDDPRCINVLYNELVSKTIDVLQKL